MLRTDAIAPEPLELLGRLMLRPELQDFALAGGTGLALQTGHRLSVDLDLFSARDFEPEVLLDRLRDEFRTELHNISKNTLNLHINGTKVDLLTYKYPMLNSLIQEGNIRIYSMEDIAAMKLSAVSSRGSKRDFYDLYFLIKKYSLSELLDFYKRKFETEQYYHVIKSLIFFDDAEGEPDPRLINSNLTWKMIKSELENAVREYTSK